MTWSDAARKAAAEVRKRRSPIRLGYWDAVGKSKKGILFAEKGTTAGFFKRERVAQQARNMRALARGTLSTKSKKLMGPTARIPKRERLTGSRGAELLNSWTASGYRKF